MCFMLEFHTDSRHYPLDRRMVGEYVHRLCTCLALLIASLAEEKHFSLTQSGLSIKHFSYFFFLDGVNSCHKIKYNVSFSLWESLSCSSLTPFVLFSSKVFMVSDHPVKESILSWLLNVWGNGLLFFFCMWISSFLTTDYWGVLFSLSWHLCWKSTDSWWMLLFQGSESVPLVYIIFYYIIELIGV